MRGGSLIFAAACFALAALVGGVSGADPADREGLELFEKKIRPALVQYCYECHSSHADPLEGKLSLETRDGVLRGGEHGPAVVPGKLDSLLLRAIRHEDKSLEMPPEKMLPAEVIADFEAWVERGAPDPRTAGAAGAKYSAADDIEVARARWPFAPVARPQVPTVKRADWAVGDVDRFILNKLEQRGLVPVADADRQTWIRRVTFDLTGLPSTPDEVDDFLADASGDAFARVVDRLLSSPRYGERWGRHWLDVVRYADTAGDNSDFPIPQMYQYRNGVIAAFNADQPYNEFVREQIAGDLLPSGDAKVDRRRIIATGYLANARRFGSRVADYPQHLTIEDTIDNLGKAFLGLSLNCARCHNYKFDPLTTEDYYAIYGIFHSTRFPWPGIELEQRQRDFVPLPGGEKELAYAVADAKKIENVKVQIKGDPERTGAVVPRRFPRLFGDKAIPGDEKGSGRRQLAEWIADPQNPLTARVMVNRLWQHHFGKGIVPTPNDFGKQGRGPTHPELLDYLAIQFVEGGWSIKRMHRLILLSHAYRLSGAEDAKALAADPANDLVWRYSRRRLDAESIRDSLLALGGNLDLSPGGEHPFPPQKDWKFTQHNPFKAVYDMNRRSVYLMTQRIQRHPYLAIFDGADTSASTGQRITSTTTLQALYLLNDKFVHEQAAQWAKRLMSAADDDLGRIRVAYRMALGREPNDAELKTNLRYLGTAREKLQTTGSNTDANSAEAWQSLARALLRTNEFVYVD